MVAYSFTSQDTYADMDLWFHTTLLCKPALKSNLVHYYRRCLFIHLSVHTKALSCANNQRHLCVQAVCENPTDPSRLQIRPLAQPRVSKARALVASTIVAENKELLAW